MLYNLSIKFKINKQGMLEIYNMHEDPPGIFFILIVYSEFASAIRKVYNRYFIHIDIMRKKYEYSKKMKIQSCYNTFIKIALKI